MYACLHARTECAPGLLLEIAGQFSPAVEQTSPGTVVFSISPLRKLIGSPYQIASEICRAGFEKKIEASLAMASNPDAAILLARNSMGVILVTPGEEYLKLARIPLSALFVHDMAVDPKLLGLLNRWGLSTCEDLAGLPEQGISERLGAAGVYLRNLASGCIHRPLRLGAPEIEYQEHLELDHPVETLEPLLFLFARVLNDLCKKLQSHGKAARQLELRLEVEPKKEFVSKLEFPVPLTDPASILKLVQLELESHGPGAAITAFSLRLEPTEPRRTQEGLFLPPTPAPEKLQLTLARIAAMVGKENVGTPALLNTHRPDAFEMTSLNATPVSQQQTEAATLRLAIRLFRPALPAQVTLSGCAPRYIRAAGVRGNVLQSAGPWKTSGEWWTFTAWTREEWDVALDDGALYRIYMQPKTTTPSRAWYVAAVYD